MVSLVPPCAELRQPNRRSGICTPQRDADRALSPARSCRQRERDEGAGAVQRGLLRRRAAAVELGGHPIAGGGAGAADATAGGGVGQRGAD
jgi:hypothetical protein